MPFIKNLSVIFRNAYTALWCCLINYSTGRWMNMVSVTIYAPREFSNTISFWMGFGWTPFLSFLSLRLTVSSLFFSSISVFHKHENLSMLELVCHTNRIALSESFFHPISLVLFLTAKTMPNSKTMFFDLRIEIRNKKKTVFEVLLFCVFTTVQIDPCMFASLRILLE